MMYSIVPLLIETNTWTSKQGSDGIFPSHSWWRCQSRISSNGNAGGGGESLPAGSAPFILVAGGQGPSSTGTVGKTKSAEGEYLLLLWTLPLPCEQLCYGGW